MNTTRDKPEMRPASRLEGVRAYEPPAPRWEITLRLDANEGPPACARVFEAMRSTRAESVRRYPDASVLESEIASAWGVEADRVVVTNGADDAIDRLCRAVLEPGRLLVTHTPSFEMIPRSARLAGGAVAQIEWVDGQFPEEAFVEAVGDDVALIALVSPNNPTGCVVPVEAVRRVAARAREVGAVLLLDLAYVEFASVDPTAGLLDLDNVVIVRTFSKAFGLAGLRVGYAIAPGKIAPWLRAAGGPYPVSSVSLGAARGAWRVGANGAYVRSVRSERERLTERCAALGLRPILGEANFVTIRSRRSAWIRDALGSLGVSVRLLERTSGGTLCRVSLPGDPGDFALLERSLGCAAQPGALLFDMDGVLADVSASYRAAIVETARAFGVELSAEDISQAKSFGDANNDWVLTKRLLAQRGVDASIGDVTAVFQRAYLGEGGRAGLRETERLIPNVELLRTLRETVPFGIVTGRPRAEAEWFLERFGLRPMFGALVAMEDAPAKPSPDGIRLAMRELGVESAWFVGDTPDDVMAARRAGAVPIGVRAPGDADGGSALLRSGAARVLDDIEQLRELL